jgi:hypothetical protein
VTPTDLQAWLATPIDWEAFEEVTLALLPDRGEVIEMPRHAHGKGVRARPQPAPIKLKKGSK